MENKNSMKIISITNLILLLVSIYANILGIIEDNSTIQYIFNLSAIAFALHYYFVGYKKKGNKYYRLFAGFLALKEMAAITYIAINEEVPAFTFIVLLLCFGICLIIAVAKDLGKKLSLALAISQIVISIITLAFVAINVRYISVITYNATRLLLASTLMLMVYVKYIDKETRGTK